MELVKLKDIWTQNILTDGENITGIVDWDRSLYGDVEIEFSVVEYCGLLDENFWASYGNKPKYNTSFYIKRAFYILYEHQKYIFIQILPREMIAPAWSRITFDVILHYPSGDLDVITARFSIYFTIFQTFQH